MKITKTPSTKNQILIAIIGVMVQNSTTTNAYNLIDKETKRLCMMLPSSVERG